MLAARSHTAMLMVWEPSELKEEICEVLESSWCKAEGHDLCQCIVEDAGVMWLVRCVGEGIPLKCGCATQQAAHC